jgi:hypothetical protein
MPSRVSLLFFFLVCMRFGRGFVSSLRLVINRMREGNKCLGPNDETYCDNLGSEKRALGALLLLLLHRRVENRANCLVKDLFEALLRERRTFEILVCIDLLCLGHAVLVCDGAALVLLAQLLDRVLVVAKIELGANKNNGNLCAIMGYLREPLRGHVLKGRRANDREADEENIGLWVGQRAETIVIFLTGCIPKPQVDRLPVDHHVRAVVVKDCRDVLTRERVCGEGDEKTGLSDRTITDNDTLDRLHCWQKRS